MRLPMLCLFGIALMSLGAAGAEVWIVDQGGGGDFYAIQEAIDASASGDEIRVEPGVYYENLDYGGKSLWIHSTSGAAGTTIDGSNGNTCVKFQSGETSDAILEGFTVRGGQGSAEYLYGGGILCWLSSPTIRDCWITDNTADHGGGLYMEESNVIIEDCDFSGNLAHRYGGAVNGNGSPTIRDCLFEANTSSMRGGAIASGALGGVIEDCVFRYNTALQGGAIEMGHAPANPVIRNCVFHDNSALDGHGGAIRTHEASTVIETCIFYHNRATVDGGGFMGHDGGTPSLFGCTFFANEADRYGGNLAVWFGTHAIVSNCIIADAPGNGGLFVSGATVTLACNDAWNNQGGNYVGVPDPTGQDGNISADPIFCGPTEEDFTLRSDSPCAAENNPGCGLIGALDVGCEPPTPARDLSWGEIKQIFRD